MQLGKAGLHLICCAVFACLRSHRRLTLGLAASTIRIYAAAVSKFQGTVGKVKFEAVDKQALEYVQSFPPLAQHAAIEKLGAASKNFFPEVSRRLPLLNRFSQQLKRQYKGLTKPPLIWDVVLLLIVQLISMGFPTTALRIYLQFDCFLRPGELCGIIARHIALQGGCLLGSQAKKVLVLLPKNKTGPLQSVRVESSLVARLLAKLVSGVAASTVLFPSYPIYRQRITKAPESLGLEYIRYSPHSIRHGATTMDLINQGEKALPGIIFRGRWESSAGKAYLQMGAASLLFAELPERLVKRARQQERLLPFLFDQVTLVPTI